MPQQNEKNVTLLGGTIVYDGINTPEEIVNQGRPTGKYKWFIKVAFPPQNPDVLLMNALAQKTLNESKIFNGVYPATAKPWPVKMVEPGKLNGQFEGWTVIKFGTQLKLPRAFDETKVEMQPNNFGQIIYTGQKS